MQRCARRSSAAARHVRAGGYAPDLLLIDGGADPISQMHEVLGSWDLAI
jgi:hypothetical protein